MRAQHYIPSICVFLYHKKLIISVNEYSTPTMSAQPPISGCSHCPVSKGSIEYNPCMITVVFVSLHILGIDRATRRAVVGLGPELIALRVEPRLALNVSVRGKSALPVKRWDLFPNHVFCLPYIRKYVLAPEIGSLASRCVLTMPLGTPTMCVLDRIL